MFVNARMDDQISVLCFFTLQILSTEARRRCRKVDTVTVKARLFRTHQSIHLSIHRFN